METHATIMAPNRKWTIVGEVISDRTRPVVGGRSAKACLEEVGRKQVIESFLEEFVNVTNPDMIFI